MRAVDTTAWGEALGVHEGFVPSALREKLRRTDELAQEAKELLGSLRDVPDEELLLALLSAHRSLVESVSLLERALRQSGR